MAYAEVTRGYRAPLGVLRMTYITGEAGCEAAKPARARHFAPCAIRRTLRARRLGHVPDAIGCHHDVP